MTYVRNCAANNVGQNAVLDFQKKALKDSLELIERAVLGEKEDEKFYDCLINIAPSTEEKEILKSIRDDERKHNAMFRRIYRDFTGRDITREGQDSFQKPKCYIDGIKKAFFKELDAVEIYRRIRQGLPYVLYRDILFEIITDEIKHAIKLNYILFLNCQQKKYKHCKENKDNKECKENKELKEYKKHMKKRLSEKMYRIGGSISETGEYALSVAKRKFKDENVLEDVIIPGVVLGLKRAYIEDNLDKNEDKAKARKELLVSCLGDFTEAALNRLKNKVDIDSIVQEYVIPQLSKE